jgi:D-tyrosyl-tRNA(Tyr) deacylase
VNVKDLDYEVLLVSQFTLFSKFKGNKLDFHRAMSPDSSRPFFDEFVKSVQSAYKADKVKSGAFGEMMLVDLQNDGPVTIIADSKDREW